MENWYSENCWFDCLELSVIIHLEVLRLSVVSSLAVLDLRVAHAMDVLSPLIYLLCYSDWLFHRESCPCLDVVHPGRAWSSSPACTWHCIILLFVLTHVGVVCCQELRDRVWHGKYHVPYHMSTACENLIKKLLVLKPANRACLEVRHDTCQVHVYLTLLFHCVHYYYYIAVCSLTCHTATGTHMPYRITQCYLPPNRGDIPAVTPAEAGTQLSDPRGMQGWFDLD